MKMHFEDRHKTAFEYPDRVRASRCGTYVKRIAFDEAPQLTDDRARVTCKSCLRYMNADEGS